MHGGPIVAVAMMYIKMEDITDADAMRRMVVEATVVTGRCDVSGWVSVSEG
jgi:hypothetical protein